MLFNSFEYVAFLVAVFLLYWAMEPGASPSSLRIARAWVGTLARGRAALHGARLVLLLAASYAFYAAWSASYLVLIVGSTLVDYLIGLALGRTEGERARKSLVALSLVVNLGVLALFKYLDFGIAAAADVLGALGWHVEPSFLGWALPVGISFYTFQTLSYTIDVYRRRIPPARSFLELATYVAFFPQLVAGPIVRAKEFLPQLREAPRLSVMGAQSAVYLIVRGMLKKVLIADFLAISVVDRVFDDPGAYSSVEVWIGIYAYTWQLYGDFSGYTDIARGSARLFGLELPHNFDRPFDTTGPVEFWKRWHITLSTWVQDYIYVPLGGSRKGELRKYANLFAAFFLIGLWHGAGWTFVIFGVLHASAVVANHVFRRWRGERLDLRPSGWKRAALVFLNVHFFVLQWPVFRAPSVERMLDVYGRMFTLDPTSWSLGAVPRVSPWALVAIVGMALLHFGPRDLLESLQRRIVAMPAPAQAALVAGVTALLLHASAGQPAPFIYFQF